MNTQGKAANQHPRVNAGYLSKLFHWHTIPLFQKGTKRELEEDDIYDPLPEHTSTKLGNAMEREWSLEIDKFNISNGKKNPSLLKAILRTFKLELTALGLLTLFIEVVLRLSAPLLLGQLLRSFQFGSSDEDRTYALYCGIGMVVINLLNMFLGNQFMLFIFYLGVKTRVAVCSLVYRKSLKLSRTALGTTPTGKVVNLLSNDVSRFEIVTLFLHYMWVGPITAIIIMVYLYCTAGIPGLIGIVVVFLIAPAQVYTGKLASIYRYQTALRTDERVRLMDEIISGVQVIKMYAWEKPFSRLVETARKLELDIIRKSGFVRGFYMTFLLCTTRLALFATMIAMVFFKEQISADKVFVYTTFYQTLSQSMSGMFVRGFSEIAEVLVSIKRLQSFLLSDEFQQKDFIRENGHDISLASTQYGSYGNSKPTPPLVNHAINMDNLSVKWSKTSESNVLHQMDVKIRKNKLIGVIGPVGAGKTSFLQTILSELITTDGQLKVNGSISYAAQEPWIFAASVRQNILFGLPYDRRKYNKVVSVCALKRDFELLQHGDMTMVGDRGISLSGGQKARLNLARAVYRDADIYLLDDPLSAVDTHVGKHLFDECINGYLSNKTRVLVTHQLQYLKDADHLILIDEGKIAIQGSYNELISSGIEFSKMLTKIEEENEEADEEVSLTSSVKRQGSNVSMASMNSTYSEGKLEDAELRAEKAEKSSSGTVQGSLLLRYYRSGSNYCVMFTMILLFILSQFFASSADYWVSYWANDEEIRASLANMTSLGNDITFSPRVAYNVTDDSANDSDESIVGTWVSAYNHFKETFLPHMTREMEMNIYTIIAICLLTFTFIRSMLFYFICVKNSQKLHDNMFKSIIETKMRFFDTNPAGRIINRFSKDMGAADELLPKALLDSGQYLFAIAGTVIVTCVVNPMFLVVVVVLGLLFNVIKNKYLIVSKSIKRLEGMTRSPIFTHLGATLQGLTTIRCCNAHEILEQEFDKHQDLNLGTWYMFLTTNALYTLSLDLFCFLFNSFVIMFSVLFAVHFGLSASAIGLVITQVMSLSMLLQIGMRQFAEYQNQLMSVERILEYTGLPSEPNLYSENPPRKTWPERGHIQFKNVFLRYADDEPNVLKDLTFEIEPREKVGIVGRTGAGKSSMIAALFRLAPIDGDIVIDGLNTADVDLHSLRKKISIIPQDPVLFSGTIRRNLDPFSEYDDQVLWSALEDVELKDVFVGMNNLDTLVSDRGSNFSVGQRQLVCLARAIIRSNKILLLDEATANVDPQTDFLIQKTIRTKFSECTVLTVAHRLNTVMDSDKIIVMGAGQLLEINHPHLLCENHDSHFYKMVLETGPAMTTELCNIAKQAYESEHFSTNL